MMMMMMMMMMVVVIRGFVLRGCNALQSARYVPKSPQPKNLKI